MHCIYGGLGISALLSDRIDACQWQKNMSAARPKKQSWFCLKAFGSFIEIVK